MKMMVILAVLFASLLMVTGAAFALPTTCASPCPDKKCYKVTGTDLTDPAGSVTVDWYICFQNDVTAYVCDTTAAVAPYTFLSLFGELLNPQAISYGSASKGVYMTFHGHDKGAFNGLLYTGDRGLLHGVQEACPPD
jgi:hypothetical protein